MQDLHGYDSPWPAGGGKNKFDQDTVYADYKQSDGSFLMTGSQAISIRTNIPQELVGNSLVFSADGKIPSGSSLTNIRLRAVVNGESINSTSTSSSDYTRLSVTFTPVSTSDYILITYGSNGTSNMQVKDIMLEINSTATAYAPYSNICPISGWNEAEIYREAEYDADADPAITVTFPDEAGTVYGGTLTVNQDGTGTLVVDRVGVDLSSLSWTSRSEQTLHRGLSAVLPYRYTPSYSVKPWGFIAENYNIVSSTSGSLIQNNGADYYDIGIYGLRQTGGQANTVYAIIAVEETTPSGKLVYKIKEPITYQLTAEQISGILTTLDGTNAIWANTGDVAVTYIAKSAKFSFNSPLHRYNFVNLKLFGNTYIEHGKG